MSEENQNTDNLSPEQTDKLIHFQEITHIESIDECKHLLEACNWNIELAVQSAFGDVIENHNLNNNVTNINNINRSSPNLAELINQNQQVNHQNINNQARQNNLPAVNILTQRTFSYYNQEIAPRGLLQWGYFLIAFPFRFLCTTLMDMVSYFWGFITPDDINSNITNYDPLANIAEFAIEFNKNYGANNHPVFYEGSYSQAVNQAKRDLKFLLVYIHQNDNSDCNKFSEETLKNQEVIDFINNTFIFWACSKNLPEGKKVFNALKAKRAPFLGLIVLRNNKMTLVARMEGPISSTELLSQLNQMIADYQQELLIARIDKETYSQTQRLREQQDQDYLESLRKDQEKARKNRELEEAKKKAIEEEIKKAEDQKIKENEIVNRKAALRKKFEEEVVDASQNGAIKLLFKLPSGRRVERIFLKTDPVKNLYNYVFSNEECPSNFEIVTNFPRKVIKCSNESEESLDCSGVSQPMLLFVNDLDA